MHQENPETLVVIEWHSGDEFDIPVGLARISGFGITGFPTAVFDGLDQVVGGYDPTSYPYYVPVFEERIATPSNFSIDIVGSPVDGTDYEISATVEILEGNTTENLGVVVVVTETDCPAIGADNQNFVARAAYPDQNGTSVDFSSQTIQVIDQTITIDDSWVFENCELVVFIQNMDTWEIYQGTSVMMTDITTGINEIISDEDIQVYPNPADDVVSIRSPEQIRMVNVFNQSGQIVYSGTANSNLYQFSTSDLNAGLYLFRIVTTEGITTRRIIVR